MQEKKEGSSIDFVKWFSELNKDSGNIAGGKGANLGEIYNLKISVPPGFVVTAQAYKYFIEKAGIKEKIKELLNKIDYENTAQLNETTEKIRKHIVNAKFPKEMEDEILESYSNLDVDELDSKQGIEVLEILKSSSEPLFVAVRSSATAEDLAEASFAGQQDSFVNVKGNNALLKHIKMCFASLFTSRATYYRHKNGFDHDKVYLAVVVQKMVDSDKSGVIFSKDPAYKNDNVVIEAVYGLGEGIVSGRITPDNYVVSRDINILDKKILEKKIAITRDSGGNKTVVKLTPERSKSQVLKDHEIKKLAEMAIKLEEHYSKPQDIEFAIEGEEIYIVQTRPITTIKKRYDSNKLSNIKGELILTGLGASPGIASGKIKIIENLADLSKIKKGDILVTTMTNPDMVVSMQRSAAIVTDEGGRTAHAAIVSREMGIPAVVGTQNATTKLKEGEIITVDGFSGKIYKGKTAETTSKEVLPVDVETKTKIKVIVDLPSFAERASRTKLKAAGLTRIEGIIAESGKHPEYFLKQNKISDYEEIIFKGISQIAEYFEEIWVRTSDIRSDEYSNLEGAPQEKEANPMLGMHGIRYGLKNPEILKAELRALKRVSEKNKTVGLLLPQIINVDEVQKTKEFLKEIEFNNAKVGVMVETPAAVQSIRDFCEEGIDFISFGTNDLTQYMLAIDRGNSEVQHLYNEMHPAILYQLAFVIRVCKRYKVETSICGQAGSRKEMAEYLVKNKIDSISVNADMASEIAKLVADTERELVAGTDEEPRKYQPEKTNEKPNNLNEGFVPPQNIIPGEYKSKTSELPEIKGTENLISEESEIQEDSNENNDIQKLNKEIIEKEPEEEKSEENIIDYENVKEEDIKDEPEEDNEEDEIEEIEDPKEIYAPQEEEFSEEKDENKKDEVLDIF